MERIWVYVLSHEADMNLYPSLMERIWVYVLSRRVSIALFIYFSPLETTYLFIVI